MPATETKLSANEATALTAWRGLPEEFDVLPFRTVQKLSGLEARLVRRTVRALARKGLVRFERGCMTEDGELAGSGYGATPAGRSALEAASHG